MTKEQFLEIIKRAYNCADDYYCWENGKLIYARASNDYPMQHGDGIFASWDKEKHRLAVREGKDYRDFILNEINKTINEKPKPSYEFESHRDN
jgi:hypothetical protein